MELVRCEGPSSLWGFDGLLLSASGSKALGRRLGHELKNPGNENDMTDSKNATHQVICFASSDNADETALFCSLCEFEIVPSVSNDKWMQSNKIEVNFCCFHRILVFGVRLLMVEYRFRQDTSQDGSQKMWQAQAAEQSHKKLRVRRRHLRVLNDYIFVFAVEVN